MVTYKRAKIHNCRQNSLGTSLLQRWRSEVRSRSSFTAFLGVEKVAQQLGAEWFFTRLVLPPDHTGLKKNGHDEQQ